MQGSAGDQGPKLGSRGPKMRQNHPETSLIAPQSIPKHIPKLLGGVIFHTRSPTNGQVPRPAPLGTRHLPALQNCQNLHGTILCDPKTHLRASLQATKRLDASYSVPRPHTITMGPYLGVPRAPWVRQNPTFQIVTVFQPILPYKTAKTSTGPSCATPKPVCGGPCG